MSNFHIIRKTRVLTDRGAFAMRFYDRLAVDFILHNLVRISVRASVGDRTPTFPPLRKELKTTLVERTLAEV